MNEATEVIGIDGCKAGWVAVVLVGGKFSRASYLKSFAQVPESFERAKVIAVDVPIGAPESGRRAADHAARSFIGPRRSSVFYTPPLDALRADTYEAANEICRRLTNSGMSSQSYALVPKIVEVATFAAADPRIIEVHPEVSFCAMAGSHLRYRKKSWNGVMERLRLLRASGIDLPEELESAGATAPIDDVLDATAAAWSADRVARGTHGVLPDASGDVGTPYIYY